MVGSCTNCSWQDMQAVTRVLEGQRVRPRVTFVVFPGSHRILETMAREGLLADSARGRRQRLGAHLRARARASATCRPPAAKSLRAFNRNFPGRSGTKDDAVYLCSPRDRGRLRAHRRHHRPARRAGAAARAALARDRCAASVAGLIPPVAAAEAATVEVLKGPNIKPVPLRRRRSTERCARRC